MSEVQNTTENGKLRSWVAGHKIISFFLLAYAISWSLWASPLWAEGRSSFYWADWVRLSQRS